MKPLEKPDVLVVDLDGTLIRSDMLFETFWSSLGSDWANIFGIQRSFLNGKAPLKKFLAENSSVPVDTLPYNNKVIEKITDWKSKGGQVALVTASDQTLADKIAEHLDLFDEVHGSDGENNLKGSKKRDFLIDRYGTRNFAYIGDCAADLPIWETASKVFVVDPPKSLLGKLDDLTAPVEVLSTRSEGLKPYKKALRPHQWLKNILVFLPAFAAHEFSAGILFSCLLAFVSFSLVASSVYVLNDLFDLSSDRMHPRKRTRPFASGAVPIAHGTWLAVSLLFAGAIIAAFLGPKFVGVMLVYYLATFAYSVTLKRRAVLDICVLAGLYTIRIIAGGAATSIPLSVWLLAFSIFFFFALAVVKRQAELIELSSRGKLEAKGRGYSVDDLPIISMMAISAGYVSVLVLALYLNSNTVSVLYTSPTALWGICFVLLYWISRIIIVTHRGHMDDDPVVFATKDRITYYCAAAIIFFVLVGLWF